MHDPSAGLRRGFARPRSYTGELWLYPGTGRGTLAARVQLGTGWGGLTIVGTGDIDFDNRADLMTRDSAGRLWIYPGNGTVGFLARRQIGSGFGQFNAMTMTEVTWHRPLLWGVGGGALPASPRPVLPPPRVAPLGQRR